MEESEKYLSPLEKKIVKLCNQLIAEVTRKEKDGIFVSLEEEKSCNGWKGTKNNLLKLAQLKQLNKEKLKDKNLSVTERKAIEDFMIKAEQYAEKEEQVYEWLQFVSAEYQKKTLLEKRKKY
ncbi:MAG: hypothetical protein WCI97_09255 [Bacteroidota bacterium]